jgi:hypothetical protein
MTEYIDREAAIKAIYDSDPFGIHKCFGWRAMDIEEALRAIPAADVAPVVRCKDCQKSGVTEFGKRFCSEPMGAFYGCIPVEDDFFCSGGRRRDGA